MPIISKEQKITGCGENTVRKNQRRISAVLGRERGLDALSQEIAEHFSKNIQLLEDARSGRISDLDELSSIDEGFGKLLPEIIGLGLSYKSLYEIVRLEAQEANLRNPSVDSTRLARAYLREFRRFRRSFR